MTAVAVKAWKIDLCGYRDGITVCVSPVPGETAEEAEATARALMADPDYWEVIGIDRAPADD